MERISLLTKLSIAIIFILSLENYALKGFSGRIGRSVAEVEWRFNPIKQRTSESAEMMNGRVPQFSQPKSTRPSTTKNSKSNGDKISGQLSNIRQRPLMPASGPLQGERTRISKGLAPQRQHIAGAQQNSQNEVEKSSGCSGTNKITVNHYHYYYYNLKWWQIFLASFGSAILFVIIRLLGHWLGKRIDNW